MIPHTDHYFSIGHRHLGQGSPCQDFALSGTAGNAAFAIVADGCSTGGHTDVGARLVAFSTAQAVRECVRSGITGQTVSLIKTQQQAVMIASRRLLGLSQQDMLATCMVAVVSPEGGFVHLKGDGVIALKFASGHVRMFRYDWANNTPAYPAYAENNHVAFIATHGGKLDAIKLELEAWYHIPGSDFQKLEGQGISLSEGIGGITLPIEKQYLENGLEYVAVFTDGVTQIENQDWKQAVVELLAFKAVMGEFAKRRMIRHIKDAKTKGNGPLDDIAYSVIRIAKEVPSATS